jgi:uncharacterized membrane protein HdeD (DUF308 family)
VKRVLIYIAQWLIDYIPNRLLDEPERFFLAFGLTIIGIDAVLLNSPASVFADHPEAKLFNVEVGALLATGGITKLLGLWRTKVWMQRLGAALLIMGCLGFVLGVLLYQPEGGGPVAIIYLFFAATYGLRILSSTALRWKLHKRGRGDNV